MGGGLSAGSADTFEADSCCQLVIYWKKLLNLVTINMKQSNGPKMGHSRAASVFGLDTSVFVFGWTVFLDVVIIGGSGI